MGDRFLVGYPYAGAWHKPDMKVVSLYVDQKPEGDLTGERAREFDFQVYPTIAEALRCGGKKLAVDAVLIIAGNYPPPISSHPASRPSSRMAAPCPSIMTASSPTASKKPKRWWTPRAA